MPPIKPSEVSKKIPEMVFEIFNNLIKREIVNNLAIVSQDDVIGSLMKKGYSRELIFENHWLDIEEHYEKAGWVVKHEKPDRGETGGSVFLFTPKKGYKVD